MYETRPQPRGRGIFSGFAVSGQLLLGLLLIGALGPWPASLTAQEVREGSPASAEASTPAREEDEGGEDTPTQLRRAQALSGIWWNRPRMIEALILDTEQRNAMDELLRASMAERRELQQRVRTSQQAFYQQAVKGDRLAAGQALGEMVESTAALQRFEAQLKLRVLGHLRPEQRRELAESFPRLLQRPWIVTRGVRRDFRRTP